MTIPAYLPNHNRLAPLVAMLPELRRLGLEPIVVDQASTYPPLFAWYASKPCEVIRFTENRGPHSLWREKLPLRRPGLYVVTDPDLDLSGVPSDALQVAEAALERFPRAKIGLSLRLDDLPPLCPTTDYVLAHELGYWKKPLPDGLFHAPVDTTFALYHTRQGEDFFYEGYRLPPPYAARHLPWYQNPTYLSPEDLYYLEHAHSGHASLAALQKTLRASPPPYEPSYEALVHAAKALRSFSVPHRQTSLPTPVLQFLHERPYWHISRRDDKALHLERLV